jgi:lipoprotein NlpI
VLGLSVPFAASAVEDDFAETRRKVAAASQRGDFATALSLASDAIKASPNMVEVWLLRAEVYNNHGDHAKAVPDLSQAIKLDPQSAELWQRRGEANFKCGKFAESVADFDKYLSMEPSQRPYHWQRGISLYYAGRCADGKKQFELHQTVNPHDVENAVWHFLCTARAEGIPAAQKQLIPIENDARVPMAQVHQLFGGKATPEEVTAAAKAAPSETRAGEPVFYANLYLGLYYEAMGDKPKAKQYILKAAERSKQNGYMGDVARVHAELLQKKQGK